MTQSTTDPKMKIIETIVLLIIIRVFRKKYKLSRFKTLRVY